MTLDQFHVGRILITESVAERQLEIKLQIERNAKEQYLQEARIEREKTAVEVNKINLKTDRILKTTIAEANLITAKAVARAGQITSDAVIMGTQNLLNALGINSLEQSTAFAYIRILQERGHDLDLTVSYLTDNNILKTISGINI